MKDRKYSKNAVKTMSRLAEEALAEANLTIDDIDLMYTSSSQFKDPRSHS